MGRSAGHLIVHQLEAHGVKRVYTVPGESFLDVLDGLHDSSIQTVVCRHEGGAGFMALAEGRLTGTPGVVMVTRGPGAANAMIAVHTAWQDATALVLFVGLIPVADRERESFQEFSITGWFGSTSKRVMVLDNPDRVGDMVAEAMHLAQSGRPGPVVVGLPEDVLTRIAEQPVSPGRPIVCATPSRAEIQSLAQRCRTAQRPMIVVGGDGWDQETGSTLMDWAVRAHIPAAADFRAYDAISHTGPAWAGWLGYGRSESLARRLDEADLLIFVGCVRSDVLSDGYTRGMTAPTVLVLNDIAATGHAGRIDQQLLSAPKVFAAHLPPPDVARGERTADWMNELTDSQRQFATPRPDGGHGVDLGIAFGILERSLPRERVLTYGAGNATIWGHRYLTHTHANSLVGARNGAMGLAVPAAVAAALIFPDRQAVAICGDGDFFMNAQELSVAFANGTTPLVIVADNGIYGTIVQHQRAHYPGRPSGTSMTNPNFASWIRSFGGHGEYVDTTEDFEEALTRALASKKPALLHLRMDPTTMPPDRRPTGQDAEA